MITKNKICYAKRDFDAVSESFETIDVKKGTSFEIIDVANELVTIVSVSCIGKNIETFIFREYLFNGFFTFDDNCKI